MVGLVTNSPLNIGGQEPAIDANKTSLSVMLGVVFVESLLNFLVANFANEFLNFAIWVSKFEKGLSLVRVEAVGGEVCMGREFFLALLAHEDPSFVEFLMVMIHFSPRADFFQTYGATLVYPMIVLPIKRR